MNRDSATRPETLVIGLHVAITVLLFGLHERFYARYFIPLVPAFCVIGSGALRAVCNSITRPGSMTRRAVGVGLACAALAFPTYASAWFTVSRARDDTEILAAHWIEEHVPVEARIALDFSVSLPVLQQRDAILESPSWSWRPWQRYQVETMPSEALGTRWNLHPIFEKGMLADKRIDLAEARARLTEIDPAWAIVSVPVESDAERDDTRLAVRDLGGELVACIVPCSSSQQTEPISSRDIDPHFVAHLLSKERLGQEIEIYRMKH